MNEPITQFLQDATKQTKPLETEKALQFKPLQNDFTFSINKAPMEKEGYLTKTDSLCHKMRKHFETVKSNTMYGDLIEGIDEMTGKNQATWFVFETGIAILQFIYVRKNSL